MSTTISNLSILFALQNTTNALSASALKLSTGLRINSAGDDPSGLAIANELQTQIDGYNQAISDGQDSTNLLKTATGAYSQITSLLNTINQNVLQAQSNLTLNPSAVAANQAAIQNAITAINNIAGTTSFGSKNLLDGSAGTSAAITNGNLVAGITLSGSRREGLSFRQEPLRSRWYRRRRRLKRLATRRMRPSTRRLRPLMEEPQARVARFPSTGRRFLSPDRTPYRRLSEKSMRFQGIRGCRRRRFRQRLGRHSTDAKHLRKQLQNQ